MHTSNWWTIQIDKWWLFRLLRNLDWTKIFAGSFQERFYNHIFKYFAKVRQEATWIVDVITDSVNFSYNEGKVKKK